jgi:hypothetical protein
MTGPSDEPRPAGHEPRGRPLEARDAGGTAVTGRAAAVERRAVELVGLLGALIARLRRPLLVLTLLPVVPAAALLVVAIVVGAGSPAVVALAGLVAPAWLTVRRRQLVRALVPADAAVADLRRTFDLAAIGAQLRDNLLRPGAGSSALRPRALAGTLWRGVSSTAALHNRVTDVSRLAPFLPGRLRGLAFLGIACVVSAVLLVGYLALGLLLSGLTGAGGWDLL